jgi:hypothetical protein
MCRFRGVEAIKNYEFFKLNIFALKYQFDMGEITGKFITFVQIF